MANLTNHSSGADHPSWIGDDVGYTGMHKRLMNSFGTPAGPCAHCGTTDPTLNYEWSYTNDDPNELVDDKGHHYSADPTFYVRRCVPCHNELDAHLKIHGEQHYRATTTEAIVLEMRALWDAGVETIPDLELRYDASYSCVYRAVHRITWKHVKDPEMV